MYADRITGSMRRAIDETARRRRVQTRYNEQRGITPVGIQKAIRGVSERLKQVAEAVPAYKTDEELPKKEVARLIKDLEKQMKEGRATARLRASGAAARSSLRAAGNVR